MLLHTKISEGCHIMATSQGTMVYGKDKKLVEELQSKIDRSNGKYWLYPDKIVFLDEKQDEQHHQNQKTSFWKKLFSY